jgi:hypothetical protein
MYSKPKSYLGWAHPRRFTGDCMQSCFEKKTNKLSTLSKPEKLGVTNKTAYARMLYAMQLK